MIGVLIGFLFNFHIVQAHEHCGDLYKFACSKNNQGKYDGTGQNLTHTQLLEKLTVKDNKERKRFEGEFDQIFRNKKSMQTRMEHFCRKATNKEKCTRNKLQVIKNYLYKGHVSIVDPGPTSKAPSALISEFKNWNFLMIPELRKLIAQARRRVDDHDIEKQKKFVKNRLFNDIKNSLKRTFHKLPDSPEREKILKTIDMMPLEIKRCDRKEHFFNQSIYNKITNTVRLCNIDLLRVSSLFSLTAIIAHEIAHGIAKNIKFENEAPKPLSSLVTCLRSAQSVNAQVGGKFILSPKKEQIEEAFCDWTAAETLADLATQEKSIFSNVTEAQFGIGVGNAVPFCEYREGMTDKDIKFYNYYKKHPLIWNRINLMGTHPKIREKMGCTNSGPQVYCPLNERPDSFKNDEETSLSEV